MPMVKERTILTKTVTPGVGGTRIRKDMYELFRKEILRAVPRRQEGITLKELGRALADALSRVEFNARGSVTWYMMAVKLDLEARGLLERVAGARPQRLRRIK